MDILTFLVSMAVLTASMFTIYLGVDRLSAKIRRWKRQKAAKKHQAAPARKLEQEMVQRPPDEPPNAESGTLPEPQ